MVRYAPEAAKKRLVPLPSGPSEHRARRARFASISVRHEVSSIHTYIRPGSSNPTSAVGPEVGSAVLTVPERVLTRIPE